MSAELIDNFYGKTQNLRRYLDEIIAKFQFDSQDQRWAFWDGPVLWNVHSTLKNVNLKVILMPFLKYCLKNGGDSKSATSVQNELRYWVSEFNRAEWVNIKDCYTQNNHIYFYDK